MTRLHEFTPSLEGGCGNTPTPPSRLVVILSLTTIVFTRFWLLGVLDLLFTFSYTFVYLIVIVYFWCIITVCV